MTASAYRAPMRSRRDDVDAAAAVERALALGLCGVGGRLERPPLTAAEALAETSLVYDDRTAARLERFMLVPDGDHVWTRDGDGLLHLGRLAGPWTYDATREAGELDLVHVRACTWLDTGFEEHRVPAGVAHTFRRGGRNFQRIRDDAAAAATAALWEDHAGG